MTSGFSAVLLDTDGVLYHRPRRERKLASFLETHGFKLRDALVVERALRAARMDVHSGRITRDMFFDAILRVHGMFDPRLLEKGRDVLLNEAADIELYPGVAETLERLQGADVRLGTVTSTPHPAGNKIAWLAARGLSPGLWTVFIASPDLGHVATPDMLFTKALHQLGVPAEQIAFVGHDSEELLQAADLGLTTVAFLPDDPGVEAHYTVGSFYGLVGVFLGEE